MSPGRGLAFRATVTAAPLTVTPVAVASGYIDGYKRRFTDRVTGRCGEEGASWVLEEMRGPPDCSHGGGCETEDEGGEGRGDERWRGMERREERRREIRAGERGEERRDQSRGERRGEERRDEAMI
eukprot:752629-Hanusia_phi.AAC.1